MHESHRSFLFASGLGALGIAVSVLSGDTVSAAGPPEGLDVRVLNTPLPVTGTLNIGGTPAVTVSGTANVNVTNPATSPVLMRDLGRPTKTRFQESGACAMDAGAGTCRAVEFAVPADKLLVIENVSVTVNVQLPNAATGQGLIAVRQPDLSFVRFELLLDPWAMFNNRNWFTRVHNVRLYADPGATVEVFGERTLGGTGAGAEVNITGYYVDCAGGVPCALP